MLINNAACGFVHTFNALAANSHFETLQIVALQTAIECMAKEFPSSFSGYSLSVIESHQAAKADTSGKHSSVCLCFVLFCFALFIATQISVSNYWMLPSSHLVYGVL